MTFSAGRGKSFVRERLTLRHTQTIRESRAVHGRGEFSYSLFLSTVGKQKTHGFNYAVPSHTERSGWRAPVCYASYQNSAFDAGSSYFYTSKNNPNVEEFEQVCAS